jgi:hypothetical protein
LSPLDPIKKTDLREFYCMHRKVLLYTAVGVLGLSIACSKSSPNPSSPSPVAQPEADAAPDGSTLKVPAPAAQAPTGGAQAQGENTLVAGTVTGKYASVSVIYRFEVRSGSTVVASGTSSGSGSTVSFTATTIEPDTNFTWRVRAESGTAFGPWSADASFKSAVGAYIRGNEIRDPMTIGRTVGTPVGNIRFNANGLQVASQDSHVRYQLQQPLEAGEFSMMVTGFDEGSPGDKTKIMSMQEGGGDITTNDYRFTVEKRGANYCCLPGATTFRIIVGGGEHAIFDGARINVAYSDERWYFWKSTWGANFAQVEVREDSPTGRVIYSQRVNTNHAYRPQPHVVYLGAPVGRAGAIDASVPGAIYKHVWLSSAPRPIFAN